MKVILLRDVARLGKRFAVVEVPDGFALNKLIPQGMAQPATPENLKRVLARNKEVAAHQAADETSLREAVRQLGEMRATVTVEANAQGHLFKAVKVGDIIAAARALGVTLPESAIEIGTPIKSVGEHDVQIKQGAVKGVITITVVAK
jgi:large subunit ribosomal protein L9